MQGKKVLMRGNSGSLTASKQLKLKLIYNIQG